MPVIPALGMVRQEGYHEFEDGLELQHSEFQASLNETCVWRNLKAHSQKYASSNKAS